MWNRQCGHIVTAADNMCKQTGICHCDLTCLSGRVLIHMETTLLHLKTRALGSITRYSQDYHTHEPGQNFNKLKVEQVLRRQSCNQNHLFRRLVMLTTLNRSSQPDFLFACTTKVTHLALMQALHPQIGQALPISLLSMCSAAHWLHRFRSHKLHILEVS